MPETLDMAAIEKRIGRIALRQRLGLEADHVTDIFGQGVNYFHIENVFWLRHFIRMSLQACFLYRRGQRNARSIRVTRHDIVLDDLPEEFDGYTLLHLSDLHLDTSRTITDALIDTVAGLDYDLCVMTGDYRSMTYGSREQTMEAMERLRPHIKDPVYAVLGNHDFIEFVTHFEMLGIRMLLNEHAEIRRNGDSLFLIGVDDPHFYLTDNLSRAMETLPEQSMKILLAHSPEIYLKAAYSGVDVLLCGHTHGGQICLPGGIAVLHNARCPRYMGSGWWRYKELVGYTSVGAGASGLDVRYHCPPEVTLHTLRSRTAAVGACS